MVACAWLFAVPQCVLERRTDTVKRSGKTASWSVVDDSDEKSDTGGPNGRVVLPFHVRAHDIMTLTFTVWDEDLTKRTADVFLGTGTFLELCSRVLQND